MKIYPSIQKNNSVIVEIAQKKPDNLKNIVEKNFPANKSDKSCLQLHFLKKLIRKIGEFLKFQVSKIKKIACRIGLIKTTDQPKQVDAIKSVPRATLTHPPLLPKFTNECSSIHKKNLSLYGESQSPSKALEKPQALGPSPKVNLSPIDNAPKVKVKSQKIFNAKKITLYSGYALGIIGASLTAIGAGATIWQKIYPDSKSS